MLDYYSSSNPILLILGDINIATTTTSANKDLSDKVQTMIGELRNIFKEYLYLMHPKYAKGSGKNPFPSGIYPFFSFLIPYLMIWSDINWFSTSI